ncbi:hypothetical protein HXX76_012774 [Chlamydomonas incerta]|uniref:UMP kinase n=1 Tax=Chlamydomonas incerta TaxID=51695 RepID=A0A835SUF8_CHLIN|nr:hypothetical protein HXX76_012774 [Chlamydomonas incerta]|eukprot:KAG2426990.1 hypothetical protein HXX76_012774 [Chlamydomonas incerta]
MLMQRAAGTLASVRPAFCAGLVRVVRPSLVAKSPVAVSDSHGPLNGATVADGRPHSNGYSFHTSSPFIFGSPSAEDLDVFKREAAGHSGRDDHSPASFSTSAASSALNVNAAAPASTSTSAPEATNYKYPRVLLKISGEALQGKNQGGIDPTVLNLVAEEIAEAHRAGLQLAVVVGGGNFFRGCTAPKGMDRAQADYVGMLATVMNAILLQGALEAMGVETRVQTAIEMREVAEPYIRRRAIRHLQERRVVIFGAGTGNPFFTTDTAAALRAAEMNADVFMKATKVDGVYDCDPMKHSHAKKYDKLSYRQVSLDGLEVMDETAITLCKENNIPVLVFNVMERGNVLKAAQGQSVGTVVEGF